MASLKLEHIYKVYPNGTKAVNDFSLEIQDKEFIVLVGPSGCGKSTTLRMIAGLEEISAGELYIGDTMVNDIEPKDRDIAMVFQNYALYPHMTVYENMAFGLTLRHTPRDVIHEKVMWAADVLGLKDYLDRKPRAMSGGQRQRVALGRAILRNPKVMLLDEPLSNLDAKLRSQMRSEISKLHLKLQTTFIYVTHDQVEAMTLGTRVVVMKGGRIQQVDSPKNLYDYPANKFVAGFIGTPQMNFFNTLLTRSGSNVEIALVDSTHNLKVPFNKLLKISKNYLDGTKGVTLGLRCENISLDPTEETKDYGIKVYVSHFEELGNETLIYAELNKDALGEMDSKTKLIVKADSSRGLKSGDEVTVYFDLNKAHYFDKKTEVSVSPRLPSENTLICSIRNNQITVADTTFALPSFYNISSLEGDAIIPLGAVEIVPNGELEATISNIQNINGQHLLYLNTNGVTYFALGTGEEKVNDKVKVSFNFAKSKIVDNNGNVHEALKEFDVITSTFSNYRTVASYVEDTSAFDVERNARMEKVSDIYDEKIANVDKEWKDELAKADELDLIAYNASLVNELNELKQNTKLETAEIKHNLNATLTELKSQKKETLATNKAEIEEYYANRILEEKDDYRTILATNKDKEVIRSRKIEHAIFLENTPREKQNDLDRKLNAISLEFDTQINASKNNASRAILDLKTKVKELEVKVKRSKNLIKNINKEYSKQIKTLLKEKEKAVTIAGLVFFFIVDDTQLIIPEKIANKIIQGLGNKVFTRSYRLFVPHDGYVVSNSGIKGRVISIKDFGKYSFFEAEVNIFGETKVLNLDASKYNLEIGQEFFFKLDLEKVQIYETKLNIRLY